jgi:hypothetical protein
MKKIQLLFVVIASLAMAVTTVAQTTTVSKRGIKFVGTTHFQRGAAARKSGGSLSGGFFRKGIEVDEGFDIPGASGNNSPARVRAAHVPTPAGNAIVNGNFTGFIGLTEFEQAYLAFAGPNGVNGELEPPDQGLAVGNGFVVEAINDAITVYDTSGSNLLGPGNSLALNFFFEQGPEATLDPVTGAIGAPFGAFISDPRVLYDASTFLPVTSCLRSRSMRIRWTVSTCSRSIPRTTAMPASADARMDALAINRWWDLTRTAFT